jgi:glycosyltransferase involved in cell wall biosynthesis
MLIHYFSHAGAETGPGRAARDWIRALRLVGAEVIEHRLDEARVTNVKDGVAVYHGSPAQLTAIELSGTARHVAVTTWETSELPVQFVRGLSHYDRVITPSSFCSNVIKQGLRNYFLSRPGIHHFLSRPGVHVVPHCFDPTEWPATARAEQRPTSCYYTIGGWGERKNVIGVLRAYLHEFSKVDKTRLVILSDGADFDVIRSVIARSGLPPDELPGLLVPDGPLSREEIVRLHQDSDCFVSTTRGEGWGLGMFEAMIMQRPVVAPCEGGQVDFLEPFESGADRRQWYSTPAQLTPVFAGEGETQETAQGTAAKLRLPNGACARQLWFEPDLGETARQMRAVYDRFHEHRDYSCFEANRKILEDCYSAPVVGSLFLSALKEISGS